MSVSQERLAPLLALLGCLLLPFALASAWTASTVKDTEVFVDTAGKLAQNSGVREAVTDQITDAVVDTLVSAAPESRGNVERFLGAQSAETLRGEVREQLTGAVRPIVSGVVESRHFPGLWQATVRATHPEVVAVLEGRAPRVDANGRVLFGLEVVLRAVTVELADQGLSGADRIIPDDLQVGLPVASVDDLDRARSAYRFLDALGWWLPLLTAGIFVTALLVTSRRADLLRLIGRGVVIGSAVLVGVLWTAEHSAAGAGGRVDPEVIRVIWHEVLTGLRETAVVAILVGLIIAALGTAMVWVRSRSLQVAGVTGTVAVAALGVAAIVVAL